MFNKIDPYLQKIVKVCNKENSVIDCLVYTNNINFLKKYFRYNNLADVVSTYPFINAIGVKVKNENILKVAKLNIVTYISSITKVSCLVYNAKHTLNLPSNLSVDNSFTCAIIDTGVSPTIDLCVPQNRIVHFVDLINHKTKPYDDNGHGTMVASVLTGNGLVSGGKYSGMVNNQNIVAIKALDYEGETQAFTILDAMEWVYKNHKRFNIKVVCMSFGSSVLGPNDPLVMGAEALWDKGITVVVAGGNSGPDYGTIKSPGASSKLITVGAMVDRGSGGKEYGIADFSSRGPALNNYKPDIVAPGLDIIAGCNYKLMHKHYSIMSGTSVSTPMIAGIVCYLLSINPKFTPNSIKNFLLRYSIPITNDRNKEGYGYFDGDILRQIK